KTIRTIDATQSLEDVTRDIQQTVTQWLQEQQA
ncbi:dTMP kinase, partial [Klebsiella pneumoniae]|nr:dTMP kinase [Klebsiella pneumoniae]